MPTWIATGFGALDISNHEGCRSDAEILVTGTHADEPIGISGGPADLYRALANGPVEESSLTDAELNLLHEFNVFGLASKNLASAHRVRQVSLPWFESPMHELVCGLVASIARQENFEVIFIKGPTLNKQGIRNKRHSGDVDVLVPPANFLRLIEALEEYGWKRQTAFWDGTGINHSTAMSAPPSWGCEIDIHEYFPGVGEPANKAFEILKESADTETFASVSSIVPNVEAHSVIYALHQIRPEFGIVRSADLLNEAAYALSVAGVESYAVARSLKADAVLEPIFRQTFSDLIFQPSSDIPFNWRWRSQDSRVAGYLFALKSLPRATRLRILMQLIWPSSELVWQSDSLAKSRSATLLQARLARYKRGLKNCLRRQPRRKLPQS